MPAIQRFAAGVGDEDLVIGYGEVELGGCPGRGSGEKGNGEGGKYGNAEQEEG